MLPAPFPKNITTPFDLGLCQQVTLTGKHSIHRHHQLPQRFRVGSARHAVCCNQQRFGRGRPRGCFAHRHAAATQNGREGMLCSMPVGGSAAPGQLLPAWWICHSMHVYMQHAVVKGDEPGACIWLQVGKMHTSLQTQIATVAALPSPAADQPQGLPPAGRARPCRGGQVWQAGARAAQHTLNLRLESGQNKNGSGSGKSAPRRPWQGWRCTAQRSTAQHAQHSAAQRTCISSPLSRSLGASSPPFAASSFRRRAGASSCASTSACANSICKQNGCAV